MLVAAGSLPRVADGAQAAPKLTPLPRGPLQVGPFFATVTPEKPCPEAVTMRYARAWTLALAVCGAASFAPVAISQTGPGTSDRDCQVIRACNFGRGGNYRGCISSYSCRVCRFVPAPCFVDGRRRVCHRMRCDWGL